MERKYNYDYSKLLERIHQKFGTVTRFSNAMDCKLSTMSMRLNNHAEWSQKDICKAIELLRISSRDVGAFFYTVNVQKDWIKFMDGNEFRATVKKYMELRNINGFKELLQDGYLGSFPTFKKKWKSPEFFTIYEIDYLIRRLNVRASDRNILKGE